MKNNDKAIRTLDILIIYLQWNRNLLHTDWIPAVMLAIRCGKLSLYNIKLADRLPINLAPAAVWSTPCTCCMCTMLYHPGTVPVYSNLVLCPLRWCIQKTFTGLQLLTEVIQKSGRGRIQSRFRCSVDNFTGMKLNLHICIKLTVWTTYCIFIVADIKEAMLTVTEPSTDPGGYRPPCHIRPL